MKEVVKWVVYAGVFAAPFIPLVVINTMFFPFITGKNFTFRIIVEIIFAAWAILALYDAAYRPKFSWIFGTFSAFIAVIFIADLFGENQLKSLWSNFERMEGFITLFHTYLYFVVVSSVLTTEKLWDRFWYTSLFAASIMAFYGFAQMGGSIDIRQSSTRLDGLLGNSAYLAMYMAFHIFVAALYFFKARSPQMKGFFMVLIISFLIILIETETRGTALGLVGGGVLTSLYVIFFGTKENPLLRKIFIGVLGFLIVTTGTVYLLRDHPLVESNSGLQRISSTSLGDLTTRLEIWDMAFEGVKERPLLGWGQGNFNYVFNKYYRPSLYGQESWFDRVHNIVMDWWIAAGILGVVTYFSVLGAALYYLIIQPLTGKKESQFSVIERALLFGLLATYVFHNLFVFDNVVSYIFYATILAMIHARVAEPIPQLVAKRFDTRVIEQIAVPVVGVLLVITVYYVNVPGIQASKDIIQAFTATSPEGTIEEFEEALSRNSFGDQEVREQMTRQSQTFLRSPQVTQEMKDRLYGRVEEELLKQVAEKPGDARVHVFISSFYRMSGNLEKAIEELEIARSLSPQKQQIIFEQGLAYLQKEDYQTAFDYFKEAYDLEPEFDEAKIFYALAAVYNGQPGLVDEIIITESEKSAFAKNDIAIQAAYQTKQYTLLSGMFENRISQNPSDPQLRVNLAVVYQESGNTAEAVAVLERAGKDIPAFKVQADQFIVDLKEGRMPGQPQVQEIQVNQ